MCEQKLTLYEFLSGVEAGAQQSRLVQVRGAVSQLAVALSQGRASQAVMTWTDRNPQQHACTQEKRSGESQLLACMQVAVV